MTNYREEFNTDSIRKVDYLQRINIREIVVKP